MPRYTLTLSPNYVKGWSISDAIREFIQNAIDQESMDEDNKKSIKVEQDTLIVANATSLLTKSSLLLGGGTKTEGDNNIGQFGEGYKVGLLVLLREGFKIEIKNFGASELWLPKIVKSKVYDSDVLAIDTKEYEFEGYNPNSLEIHITKSGFDFNNILSKIWLEFDTSLLDLDIIKTSKCDIILDELYKHKIYVKGLYIGELKELEYGYNFAPNLIKIGRDRNLINSFDIFWDLSRKIWNNIDFNDSRYCQILKTLIEKECKEIEYLEIQYLPKEFRDLLIEEHKDDYVVSNEEDKKAIKETFGDVITKVVPKKIKEVVYNYQATENRIIIKQKSGYELLEEFMEKYEDKLSDEMLDELEIILNKIN